VKVDHKDELISYYKDVGSDGFYPTTNRQRRSLSSSGSFQNFSIQSVNFHILIGMTWAGINVFFANVYTESNAHIYACSALSSRTRLTDRPNSSVLCSSTKSTTAACRPIRL